MYLPVPPIQLSVLPALVNALPALAEMEVMFAGGNASIHSIAEGSLPAGDVSVRFSEADPVAEAIPDDNDREAVWAKQLSA